MSSQLRAPESRRTAYINSTVINQTKGTARAECTMAAFGGFMQMTDGKKNWSRTRFKRNLKMKDGVCLCSLVVCGTDGVVIIKSIRLRDDGELQLLKHPRPGTHKTPPRGPIYSKSTRLSGRGEAGCFHITLTHALKTRGGAVTEDGGLLPRK